MSQTARPFNNPKLPGQIERRADIFIKGDGAFQDYVGSLFEIRTELPTIDSILVLSRSCPKEGYYILQT